MKKVDDLISNVNRRLKAGNVRLKIVRHGSRLSLRGIFPPKPGEVKTQPYQQRLSLGIGATAEGVRYAEAKAKEISGQLDLKIFDWSEFFLPESESRESIGYWVERFESDYFNRRGRTPETLTTWKTNYFQVFRRLPSDHILDPDWLYQQIVALSQPNTRSRKRFCLAIGALAKFAGIELDTKGLQGNYSPKSVTPRNLPDDSLIVESFSLITDPCWQWVYGMMATYGLRNHETFFTELSLSGICQVLEGKTGARLVWGIYPEWVDFFKLQDVHIPNYKGQSHADYGMQVTKAFERFNIPFTPYTLRHCWAVRALEFGLDISLAAAQMGHSVLEHNRTYQHWISERTHQRAYDLLINRSDRPRPIFPTDFPELNWFFGT